MELLSPIIGFLSTLYEVVCRRNESRIRITFGFQDAFSYVEGEPEPEECFTITIRNESKSEITIGSCFFKTRENRDIWISTKNSGTLHDPFKPLTVKHVVYLKRDLAIKLIELGESGDIKVRLVLRDVLDNTYTSKKFLFDTDKYCS